MSRLDMAIGAIVAAAILTPEGRGATAKTSSAIGVLGNKAIKAKFGIDLNDVTDVFNTTKKGDNTDVIRKQDSTKSGN